MEWQAVFWKEARTWRLHPSSERVIPLFILFISFCDLASGSQWRALRGCASARSPQTFVSSLHSSSSSRSRASPPFHSVFPSSRHHHHSHQFQNSTESVYLSYWENRLEILSAFVKDFFSCEMKKKKKINAKINWLCKSQDCHALNWLWMTALCAIFNGPLFKLHTYIFWF